MNINFNVSARMALLIGRDSIPSSNGAIGEIVKNAYDADAYEVTVIFDTLFEEAPQNIDSNLLTNLFEKYKSSMSYDSDILNYIQNNYLKSSELYILKKDSDIDYDKIMIFFNVFNNITIIDNGEGMDQQTIEDYWMTIGTHNKVSKSKTLLGRSTVGSKGIGRFSLDKLGELCTMFTKKDDGTLLEWKINWNDFEKENAKLTDINASLIEIEIEEYSSIVQHLVDDTFRSNKINLSEYKNGTMIKITSLREVWNKDRLKRIKGDLLSLIPINIFHPFRIFFVSKQFEEISEEIKRPLLSDYDYRVEFEMINSHINVSIIRSEFNYKIMNTDLSEQIEINLMDNYEKHNLVDSSLESTTYQLNIDDFIIPGTNNNLLKNIGNFKFSFDYFKQSSTRADSKKYYYKSFDSRNRRAFLSENSGIKVYRDGFRVRPYGEKDSFSYDWLGLGLEVSKNPASMSHKGGNWHIRPNQIMGRVDISRHSNPMLSDNASRQGIDLNIEFEMFVKLLQHLIGVFEKDRLIIATSILKYDKEAIEKKEKEKEVKAALDKAEKSESLTTQENKDIAKSYKQKEEEIKALNYELNVLKSYSTSSMFTRVFSHEIKHINNNLKQRLGQLNPILKKFISEDDLKDIADKRNPFISLQSMNEDIKVLNSYIKIMTSNTIKDKRTRTDTEMNLYIEEFDSNWSHILLSRDITLTMKSDNFKFKCFDFDLFSIITNLIINSSEAFLDEKFNGNREITIEALNINSVFVLNYIDSGPGLDERIKNPHDIFQESFTTKKYGTGIGMWILQTLVNEYHGDIIFNDVRNGFNLSISFPKGVKSIG